MQGCSIESIGLLCILQLPRAELWNVDTSNIGTKSRIWKKLSACMYNCIPAKVCVFFIELYLTIKDRIMRPERKRAGSVIHYNAGYIT